MARTRHHIQRRLTTRDGSAETRIKQIERVEDTDIGLNSRRLIRTAHATDVAVRIDKSRDDGLALGINHRCIRGHRKIRTDAHDLAVLDDEGASRNFPKALLARDSENASVGERNRSLLGESGKRKSKRSRDSDKA